MALGSKVSALRRAKALPPVGTGARERRLHLQAHNYWATLPRAGSVPHWRDFDPMMIDDRCTQSFVIDLDAGEPPHLRLIGEALQAEGGVGTDVIGLADAPPGSLLMRISSYLPELLTRAVPLSVEAPYETTDGIPGIYRALLMPFTTDGNGIDVVFGVVSWRETARAGERPDAARIVPIRS
ncbi:PAS domain-containing protein [Sphingosinicella microcystinivorans]|uniref:PAS domain-containing protein n=1 Tax=Sphingosinicella microcystinivorans TaxID=335406 RepID=UPI0022F3FD24|nr:PAS domain-containing protein [Sphingosinicella microcystinivorans]WBX84865.1 PAS domain-containing protein [Sphingosinicella microcystinivorans]